jgi:branched-chain amino acid transport system ATP-binding protein
VTALLRVEGVTKQFGGLRAVDNLGLELCRGEILGVIGPNGAGKTTLFSIIAGSIPATTGCVFLEDRRISGLPAHRVVRAGVVRTHQIVRPFTNLTVLENVMTGALFGPKSRARARAHVRHGALDLLGFVGLGRRAGDYPASLTLSGRKRLELARALATKPSVLLLDEVIAGLNPAEVQRLVALIRQIRDERGMSIMMIEHVMPAVMTLCDRIVVLNHGQKISEGPPAAVARDPLVVAAYLGGGRPGSQPALGVP